MIEVKNLEKSFGDLHILKGITTTIEKGEKVVIIGPSGSGKSTFLRCLNRLEQPTSGQILFEGQDLTRIPDKQLYAVREKMGMVFQHFHLFPHLTIRKTYCKTACISFDKRILCHQLVHYRSVRLCDRISLNLVIQSVSI